MTEENPWHILNSKPIYENNWISLTEHNVINPSGGKGIYGEVHFKNFAIGIIAIDEDDKIFMLTDQHITKHRIWRGYNMQSFLYFLGGRKTK